jgi:hypothetical protein
MRALRHHILVILGPLLLFAGFMYGAVFVSVPYQDPSPDVTERWNRDRRNADTICLAGALILAGGCLQEIIRSLGRRRGGPQN